MTNFINPSTTLGTAPRKLPVAVPKVVLGLIKFVMTVPPTAEQCRSLSWERAAADTPIGFPLAETNAKNNTAEDKTSPAGPIFRTVMNNLPFSLFAGACPARVEAMLLSLCYSGNGGRKG